MSRVLITGATGLIGTRLIKKLSLKDHSIAILSRQKNRSLKKGKSFQWNPQQNFIDPDALKEPVEVVIHLAGESVGQRWTKKRKEEIYRSRVDGTKFLINALGQLPTPPKKLIASSAIGIYGDRGGEKITEESPLDSGSGDDFLAKVCRAWEEASLEHNISTLKSYALRTGVVLSKEGGALKQMLPPFKLGAGGVLGSGQQFMSWIHIEDLVDQIIFLMENDLPPGAYNGVAPNPVTNYQFTKTLGRVLRRPTIFPVPAPILKVLLGEMSQLLLGGQRVLPEAFLREKFSFSHPRLEDALKNIFVGL